MDIQESAAVSPSAGTAAQALETVELSTGPEPTAAIVWLHGLGADGHDFEPIVPELMWPGAPDIRFVFPHAPVRPVTINGGMPMRAWYDILNLTAARGHDERGIVESVNSVATLLRAEIARGIPSHRILLAGFSQGGAIALQLALRFPEALAGLIVLSSYVLFGERLSAQRSVANSALPVFAAHGTMDPVVPLAMGEHVKNTLIEMGHAVEWHSYPMPHAVCPQEIEHLSAWLKKILD